MAEAERPELLNEIFDIEDQWQAAKDRADALEAEAKQLRSGWSDKRWDAMYTAARALEQGWAAGEISLEEALSIKDEIAAREYDRSYMCGAAATAATIRSMQPGEPVYGPGDGFETGIIAAAPVLTFSAHEKRKGVANPTVLGMGLTVAVRRLPRGADTLDSEVTESHPYVKYISERYVVGRGALQTMLDAEVFSEGHERDYCGSGHGRSYRHSNTSHLKDLVNMANAFAKEGIELDVSALAAQIKVGEEKDMAAFRARQLATRMRFGHLSLGSERR